MPLDTNAFWMPYTANRMFKAAPRMFVGAEGMHYVTEDGRRVLDATAGLWCVNAGHCRPPIVEAVQQAAARLDYAPSFQFGHPDAFRLAEALAGQMPGSLKRIFFTNSGSEAVETALKIALAYQKARGQSQRVRLIGRERGYHGVNFGGMSVGGIQANRKAFTQFLPFVDHLPHTLDLNHMAFSKGQPVWGMHLAEELERLIALHGAETIAAVIVEPVACSTGVLVPPQGYLQRLREITARNGILLIFDEVITAFGRVGAATAAERFNVIPDMITMAKGLTNAAVPMGAVAIHDDIQAAFMAGPEHLIELFHGYTYSGHPLAAAAGLATLEVFKEEGLYDRSRSLEAQWQERIHALRDLPNVKDIRNFGLIGAIELEPLAGQPTRRAYNALVDCYERGLLIRTTSDIIALSPPLIVEPDQIDWIFDTLAQSLRAVA